MSCQCRLTAVGVRPVAEPVRDVGPAVDAQLGPRVARGADHGP